MAAADLEFVERLENFAFDTVVNRDDLDARTRFMCILAALMGCQEVDTFKVVSAGALNFGVSALEVNEIIYQGVNYLGLARALPFLRRFKCKLLEKLRHRQAHRHALKEQQREQNEFDESATLRFGRASG